MIEVEIWSDFACPFCYIGKAHFEKALSQFQKDVKVTFKSFELDPSAKKSQKTSIYEVLAIKYGQSLDWAKKANQNVTRMGAQAGLIFEMDKVIPTNTFDAHRVNQLAARHGKQSLWQDRMFQAYFTEGKDIADVATLKNEATQIGLPAQEVEKIFQSEEFESKVREQEDEAHEMGIQGVPFFLFNREFGISGAQPTQAFLEALQELAEREK